MTLHDLKNDGPTPASKYKIPSPPKSPKCAAAARALFGGGNSRKKQIDKFYQKQFNLVESFEQDSRQIQNFQQHKKQLQTQNSLKSSRSADIEQMADEQATDLNIPLIDGTQQEEGTVEVAKLLQPDRDDTLLKSPMANGNGQEGQSQIRIINPTNSMRKSVQGSSSSKQGKNPLARTVRRLAFFTLMVNLLLTLAKALASYLSGSLSIISSLVDSLVDITSGLVIWLTGRAIRKRDPYLYPVGRTRLEPVALVIVSVIMAVASVQMIVQSLESILGNRINPHVDWPTIGIMVATVAVKMCLFILCNRFRNDPSTRVLAQDHRNDCLSNSIALLCAFGAQKFWLYLDPIGAIIVALYIAITWYRTGREHLMMLSGRSAEPEFINRIIKVCIDHDPRILYMDTVYVYHFGTRFLVEVHIVLDENMRLKEAHDISESLQNSIEALPDVERAFLHVDYEFEHKPQDEHKIP